MSGDRVESTRETVAISSCVWGYHVYKDRQKPRVGEKLACVRESTNIEDRCAVAVVKNQRSRGRNRERQATLWIRQHAFLRSAQTLEVFSIDISALSDLRLCFVQRSVQRGDWRGKFTVLFFGVNSNFRRFNFQHSVAVQKLNPFENNRLYGITYLFHQATKMAC